MALAKQHSTNGSRPKSIEIKKIRLDGDTQSREELDEDVIKEYADLMAGGVEFPPLTVVFDGSSYWLVDGFHRRFAAVKAKLDKFKCIVVTGTREDARWLSYGSNIDHGMRRTNDDKAKAVIAALKHPNGAKCSDSKIAGHVGVSVATVGKYRKQLGATFQIEKSTEREGSDGRTINTANIGSKPRATATESDPPTIDKADPPKPDKRLDFDTAKLTKELAQEKKNGAVKKQWQDKAVLDALGIFAKQIDAAYGGFIALFDECQAEAGGTEADVSRAKRAAGNLKAKAHELLDGVTTAFRMWRPKK